jgi:hypothetical protein
MYSYRPLLAFSRCAEDAWLKERQMPHNAHGFFIEAGAQAFDNVREGYPAGWFDNALHQHVGIDWGARRGGAHKCLDLRIEGPVPTREGRLFIQQIFVVATRRLQLKRVPGGALRSGVAVSDINLTQLVECLSLHVFLMVRQKPMRPQTAQH